LDTNIWLLGTTGVVTILHMLFETLAFKNDIVSNMPSRNALRLLTWKSFSPTGVRRRILSVPLSEPFWQTSSCRPLSSCTSWTTARTHLG
jgi:hypothetical protein